MEKFSAYVVFISATYKPSNTIWPVSFLKSTSTKYRQTQQ